MLHLILFKDVPVKVLTIVQGKIISPSIPEEGRITNGARFDHKIMKNADLSYQSTCSIGASFLQQDMVVFGEVNTNQEKTQGW